MTAEMAWLEEHVEFRASHEGGYDLVGFHDGHRYNIAIHTPHADDSDLFTVHVDDIAYYTGSDWPATWHLPERLAAA